MNAMRVSRSDAVVRFADPEFRELRELVFSRYPHAEWASFARFGWRSSSQGLLLTLAALDPPSGGDLDESVAHVAFQEPYSLRAALNAEKHPLAVGVVHSHPRDCAPVASAVDDDMDAYYSAYFSDFAPDRPYVSVILSEDSGGELAASARIWWQREWIQARKIVIERTPSRTWPMYRETTPHTEEPRARLSAAFGKAAAARLRRATVGVVGAGGTGSVAIEVLARAGVGRIIIVDPDHFEASNLERVHGSRPDHAAEAVSKAALAREHVQSIDPSCEVVPFVGALPQPDVIDALVDVDVVLGCTDQQHSRVALSDIALRYLIPSIDCGVVLEGQDGRITAQVLQLVRFLAADPCVYCRSMVVPERLAQELMSPEERELRRVAAERARCEGRDGNPYWFDSPQLNTVGYHTTVTGALAAGYAIGWITGRFEPPFSRLQVNLVAPQLEVVDADDSPDSSCVCRRVRGWAECAAADAFLSAPPHWPIPIRV